MHDAILNKEQPQLVRKVLKLMRRLFNERAAEEEAERLRRRVRIIAIFAGMTG